MPSDPGARTARPSLALNARLLATLAGFAVAAGAGYFAGRHGPSDGRPVAAHAAAAPVPVATPQPPVAPPTPEVVDPREPEPRAVELRAEAIRRDASRIEEECRNASGDWDQWQAKTAPYRAALKAKIDRLKSTGWPVRGPDDEFEALEGLNGFPLFEMAARTNLNYLYDPSTLDGFRRDRAVVAADRWLRRRGVDLIFVPVPKMAEVYIDHFLEECPADKIIAPHARRTLLELLREGVEVVDGFRLFTPQREIHGEYLYNPAETHWSPLGMRVMAREIADRVARYKFGARARFGMPIVAATPSDFKIVSIIDPMTSPALTPEQKRRAAAAQNKKILSVSLPGGGNVPDDPNSPVTLIGNSYAITFWDALIRELNLRISKGVTSGQTTEAFAEFARDPDEAARCRVVIWITTEQHMTHFRPMPQPIMNALEESGDAP